MSLSSVDPGADRIARLARLALSVVLALVCAYWIIGSLLRVWRFGFGEMFADQFRQYLRLFDAGPVEAALMADNGHRMVLSNWLRQIDIAWGGDQVVLIAAGALAMLGAWCLGSLAAMRSERTAWTVRLSAMLVLALGLFWHGSGRMQFHGNESFQIYLVLICALAAVLLQARYLRDYAWPWLAGSLGLALLGAFSFAPGVAIFPTLIVMALLSRSPIRRLWPSLMATCLMLLAYLFMLPGGDGVRGTLAFDPLGLMALIPAWLASACLWALPGLGDASVFGIGGSDLLTHPGTAGIAGAMAGLRSATGIEAQGNVVAVPLGAAGMLWLSALSVDVLVRGRFENPLHRVGLGLAVFCAGVAALVAVGRMEYFASRPEQVFADRYVVWSAMFWTGLGVATLGRFASHYALTWAAPVLALSLAALLWPTQRLGAGWAESAARMIESRAAALQAGVYPAGIVEHMDLPDLDAVIAHRQTYRSLALGPFRSARSRAESVALSGTWEALPEARFEWREDPAANGQRLRVLGGVLPSGLSREGLEGLLLLDPEARVIGYGEFSHASGEMRLGRLPEAARGFDVYLVPGQVCGPWRLIAADAALERPRILAEVDPCAPAAGQQGEAE